MARILLLILSIAVLPMVGVGQVNELPTHFGQVLNNPLLNPAIGGAEANVEFTLAGKQNTKEFSNVRSSIFTSYFRLKDKGSSFHTIGIQFQSAGEGAYLRRNRAYLSYSRHQRISETWYLAGGISGGMYSFSIKSNTITGGATSETMDANVGVQLYDEKTALALSFLQANEGEVQPFEQKIKLQSHINASIRHRLDVSDKFKFTPFAYYRDAGQGRIGTQQRLGVGGILLLDNVLNVGASAENEEGVYTFLGLENLLINPSKSDVKENRVDLNLSYFIPFLSNERTVVNSFELNIKYFINKAPE